MHAGDLYLSNGCPHCRTTYNQLCARGYRKLVRLRRLEEEPDAMRDFDRMGGGGVPLLVTPQGRAVYGDYFILEALQEAASK